MKRLAARGIRAISDASLISVGLAGLALWEREWFYLGIAVVVLGSGLWLDPWAKKVLSD